MKTSTKNKNDVFRFQKGFGRLIMLPGMVAVCLLFLHLSNVAIAQNIVQAEYFINNDPGFGLGTTIPVPAPSENIENLSFVSDVSLMEAGFNALFVRAKDANGRWTQSHQQLFYKNVVSFEQPANLVQAEYFFNIDPGFGNGINIPINTPAQNIQNLSFVSDVSLLEAGFNTLIVRVKSAKGIWSNAQVRQFYKAMLTTELPLMVQAEYFINDDPGFGGGINIPIALPSQKLENLSFVADVSSFEPGFNTMMVRVKDEAGIWTQTHVRQFYKALYPAGLPEIVQAEYYINSDPGVGLGINIPITLPSAKIEDVSLVVDITTLDLGVNRIFIRSKDERGVWSLTNVQEFCKAPVPDFATDFAELGNPSTFSNLTQLASPDTEYFWDVDGDGIDDYSGVEDFLHLYEAPGSYTARLIVTIPEGCTDSIFHEVLVYACMVPTALSVENITYNSAELSWTPGNFGSAWDILWGLQGFDPETEGTLIEGVSDMLFNLEGLEKQTDYDFYVRTVCDAPDVSDWSGPESFTTLQYFCTPDWEPTTFNQYNMQIIGKLFIEGEQSLDPHDFIGAFVDGECRGLASPDPDLFGLVFLSVGSDLASGEMVDFVIWNVDECAECPTGESILFENQLQVGTPGNPYPFECGQHELPLTFGTGYNWFSVNIDPGSMALNDLFAELNPCEEDRIIGQNAFSIVYNGNWVGSLTAIEASGMYKMQLCNQQNITIAGTPAANNPISLGSGYTWLGYLPQGGLSVNNALSAITPTPVEDNRLIGQNAFAVFYQGQWIGSLTQVHPGKGYVIELSSESTLTYPAATDEILEPVEEIFSPTGEMPLAFQQFSMMLIAQLELPDGSISTNPEDVIYAYAGDECRGMAIPAGEHGGIVFMSINSNIQAGEQITFKAWLSEFGALADIRESIGFEELKKAGTMDEPLLLTVKGFTGTEENLAGNIFIGEPFPNPFSEITEIPFSLNNSAQVKISLYDAQGKLMDIVSESEFAAGRHKAVIHRNALQPGVYFYRMEVFNDQISTQKNGKIIIK